MNTCVCITGPDEIGLYCGTPQHTLFFQSPPIGMCDDEVSIFNEVQPHVPAVWCPIFEKGSGVCHQISDKVGIYLLHSQMKRNFWQESRLQRSKPNMKSGTHCRPLDCASVSALPGGDAI